MHDFAKTVFSFEIDYDSLLHFLICFAVGMQETHCCWKMVQLAPISPP